MKIPGQVRINGVDYTVNECDNLNDGIRVLYGEVNYSHSEIRLNGSNQNHQSKCITLWHEILHAIAYANGYEFTNSQQEEKVVEMMARGVYQVLQDNGKLMFDIKEK